MGEDMNPSAELARERLSIRESDRALGRVADMSDYDAAVWTPGIDDMGQPGAVRRRLGLAQHPGTKPS